MAFDGIVIANLAKELSDTLTGGRISKIAQPEPDELILTIKAQTGTYRLLLSANASLPLAYLTDSNALNPMTAPNFCMLLRKHIGNARILSITQPGLERVLHLHLEHLDEMGDLRRKTLTIELMGKYSNIIFCDEQNQIIDSIKHVSALISSVREVLPGRPYFIPDTTGKHNPLSESREGFLEHFHGSMPAAAFLSKTYTGISNVSAEELVSRSRIDSSLPVDVLSEEERVRIAEQFLLTMEEIQNGHFHPCIIKKQEEPIEFASLLLTGSYDCELTEYSSISYVLESYFAVKNQLSRIRQKSVMLRRVVQNALERSSKKYDLQLRQLKDTEKREKYRIYGEMLHTYGYQCPPGAKELSVINYYTNEPLTIPLDPTLSPAENAKKYFDRYGKLKRTNDALSQLTKETKAELAHLQSVSTSLDIARTAADLEQIRQELILCGYLKPHAQDKSKKGKKDNRLKNQPYHYRSSDGFDLYVGKNNLQNEELTFQFASGNDMWMHAKKQPGSHVIIKSGGREIPDRTYEEAGALAAYYSAGRNAPKVEIDYVERRQVKKPSGAKPGFVIYHTNYSLLATPDISSLTLLDDGHQRD